MTSYCYYAMNTSHSPVSMTFLPSKNRIYKSSNNKNSNKNPFKTGTKTNPPKKSP